MATPPPDNPTPPTWLDKLRQQPTDGDSPLASPLPQELLNNAPEHPEARPEPAPQITEPEPPVQVQPVTAAPEAVSGPVKPPSSGHVQPSWRRYLRSADFFRLLVSSAAVGLGTVLLLLFVLLPIITRHGATELLPNVQKKPFTEARELLEEAGFKVAVIDSQYFPDLAPTAVIAQQPQPRALAKPGRTVYLVLNKQTPPGTKVPEIIDVNLQQVEYLLENWGLKRGKVSYVGGPARDVVIAATVDGQKVAPGDILPMGTALDLTVTQGYGSERIRVPNVVGLSLQDAASVLNDRGLGLGTVRFGKSGQYREKGIVYRQNPDPANDKTVVQGYTVDVYVTGDGPESATEGMGAVPE